MRAVYSKRSQQQRHTLPDLAAFGMEDMGTLSIHDTVMTSPEEHAFPVVAQATPVVVALGRRRMSWHALKRTDSSTHEKSLKSLINAAGMGNMIGFSSNLPTSNEAQLDQIIPNFVSKQVRQVCYQMCAEVALKSDSGSQEPLAIPPLVPSATEAFAAVVMVDVSGYSKLTAVLAERGPIGAELLTRTMKGYLDKIIQTIVAHGGDIVKFAGDAVIFCWKSGKAINLTDSSQDKIRGELVYKASHCCLTLLTKLGTYDIEVEDCPTKILRIHLGIGAGLVYDVLVGGEPGRWEHFIAGDGVNQLSQVLDLAKAGELALSHQALKWLACVIDIATVNLGDYDKRCIILTGLEKAVRKGHASPDVEDEIVFKSARQMEANVDLYKLFVDRTALFKLQADINQSRLFQMDAGLLDLLNLTELRQVTTIFIKVGSLQVVHRNDILDESQRAISIVQTALHRCEGSLRQFHVDDKGAVILCFFGLPPLAHENDAGLGIKAGIEIRDRFFDIFDDFSIGITTGVVSYGGVGSSGRAEYAVMGDSINMAARLMCHAEAAEGILCDEKTYNLCALDFSFQNLGETKVKGKNSAISIFRPIAPVPESNKNKNSSISAATASIEVIGREKERKCIMDALCRMKTAVVADAIIIKADGGQGLSTLISFANFEATKQQCHVCVGNCVEMEKSSLYFPWQSIIHDLVDLIDSGSFVNNTCFKIPTHPTHPTPNLEASMTQAMFSSPPSLPEKLKLDATLVPSLDPSFSNAAGVDALTSQFIGKSLSSVKEGVDNTSPFKSQKPNSPPQFDSDEFLSERTFPTARGKLTSSHPSGSDAMVEASEEENYIPKIAQALFKLHEASEDAGLFELIFPAKIDGELNIEVQAALQLRIHDLCALLSRVLRTLSEHNKLIFVLNEAQWMDPMSWEFLMEVLVSCPRVAVFIFTRPEGSFESRESKACLRRIEALPRTTTLTVGGLNIEETRRLIIHTWTGPTITKVASKIVESIYKRTDGNPFFIRSLTLAMKESGQWRVSNEGVLSTQNGNFDFEKLVLGYDNQSILVAQFDRLDRNFQLLLKVAAVLGQRFLLDDVLYFLTGMAGVHERIERKNYNQIIRGVQTTDKYGFLQRDATTSEGAQFQFKSAVVRKCIYSMMVHKQRQQLHKHVGTYYETRLNDANRHRYLIPIFEHFMESDGTQTRKKIHYLEMVANFYYERGLVNECIKFYKQLLDISGLFRKDLPEGMDFKNATIANWHRELGHSLYMREEYIEAEKHLLIGLKLYGAAFPETKLGVYWSTRRQLQIRLRMDAAFFENFGTSSETPIDYLQSYRPHKSNSSHSLNNIVVSTSRRKDVSSTEKRGSTIIQLPPPVGAPLVGFNANFSITMSSPISSATPPVNNNNNNSGSNGNNISLAAAAPLDSLGVYEYGRSSQVNLGPNSRRSTQIVGGNYPPASPYISGALGTSSHGGSGSVIHDYESMPTSQVRMSQNMASGSSSKYGIKDRNTSQNLMREPGSARQGPAHGIQHSLLVLADLYWIRNQFQRHQVCVLLGLNMVHEATQDQTLARLFSLGSLTLWMAQIHPHRALSYLDAAQRLDSRTNIHTSIHISTHQCELMFLMGRWQIALKASDALNYLGTIASDTLTRVQAMRLRLHIQMMAASRQTALATAREMYTFSSTRECFLGRFSACLRLVECLSSIPYSAGELGDYTKILDDLWGSQTNGSTIVLAEEIAYLGLRSQIQLTVCTATQVRNLALFSDALGKLTTYEWKSFQGMVSVAFGLFAAYESKALNDSSSRKVAELVCVRVNKLLKPMKGLSFSDPLRMIFKGFRMLQANRRLKALATWTRGLNPKSEVLLIQAFLHKLIAYYSQGELAYMDNVVQGKRLVDILQITYLFDMIWKTQ
ncbi:hypothetical protein BASA62_004102 [Batrachochytrium salamandrivorans]|nr:hypothetical protein BASA62_004102 [Batrachochytrium salamandrivorans]